MAACPLTTLVRCILLRTPADTSHTGCVCHLCIMLYAAVMAKPPLL